MRKAEFNEILEECLEAALQGRRTVDECLSLYPRFARELEPLLTTALEVEDAFQTESAPWHVQERVHLRVLAAYQSRIRSRNLVSEIDLGHSGHWSPRHWAALASSVAAALGAVAVVSLLVLGATWDQQGANGNAGPFIVELHERAERASQAYAEDGRIDDVSLAAIARQTRDFLAEHRTADSIIGGLGPDQLAQLQITIADAGAFLNTLPPDQRVGPGLGSTVADVQKDVDDIATMIAGVAGATAASGGTTDASSPTDAPSPTSTPSPQATPAPSPTDTAPATPVPALVPSP